MEEIEEKYVSLKVAILLKDAGFDIPTLHYWEHDIGDRGKLCENYYGKKQKNSEMNPKYGMQTHFSAPSQALACQWLRKIHHVHIEALCPVIDMDAGIYGVKYSVIISNLDNNCIAWQTRIEDTEYDSYEDAIEAGLKYYLSNIYKKV